MKNCRQDVGRQRKGKLMDVAAQAYQKTRHQNDRDTLIVEHIKDVKHILGRVAANLPEYVDRDNLEAAGMLGLVEAAHQFNPERKVEFSVFAYHRIRGAILDELRRNCPLSQNMLARWALIREVMEQANGFIAIEDIAARLDLSPEDVDACMEAIRLTRPEEWNDEFGFRVNPMLSDLENAEKQQQLEEAIYKLDERSREALVMYYLEDMRMKEVGEVLSLSESRVSRLISEAVRRIRMTIGDQPA